MNPTNTIETIKQLDSEIVYKFGIGRFKHMPKNELASILAFLARFSFLSNRTIFSYAVATYRQVYVAFATSLIK